MAKAGANLALVDLKKENLASTVAQCKELGVVVLPLEANVVDQVAVDKALQEYSTCLDGVTVGRRISWERLMFL